MDREIRFTKIKFDGQKVRLEYERLRGEADPDEFSLHTAERPAPEFDQALQALIPDVVKICELPEDDAKKLLVRGVTLTHAQDVLGCVVTALKALKTANSPLVLNTPHLPEAQYSETGESPVMHDGMSDRLNELVVQAHRYLKGDRAQGDLFAGKTAEELKSEAGMHEAAARLGDGLGAGGSCTLTGPGGVVVEFNEQTSRQHRAHAKALRDEAGRTH